MIVESASSILCALIIGLLAPVAVKPLLRRLGVIDIPNARSSHSVPALRGAGLAPLLGIISGYCVLLSFPIGIANSALLSVLLGISLASAALGWVEDHKGAPIAIRAGVQLLIGALGSCGIAVATGMPGAWVPVAAVGIAAYINVANFMDGVDAVSALHGLTAGIGFSVLGALIAEPVIAAAGLIVSAAFVAFLPWNLRGAGMFLGDIGSYLLGGSVAGIAVACIALGAPLVAAFGPLAIYFADTGFTLFRRILAGERWYESHRRHTYHRLEDLGFKHTTAAICVTAAGMATSAIGLVSLRAQTFEQILLILAMLAVAVFYLSLPWVVLRFKRGVQETSAGRAAGSGGVHE